VFIDSSRSGAAAALAVAIALCGCTNYDVGGSWFSKPLDLFGTRSGYNYSSLDQARLDRPVTAKDLVDANGACPGLPALAPLQSASADAGAGPAPPADAAAVPGGGVAIGMSECDVVARLGQAAAVNLGRNAGGDRTAVLTFKSGPRPGVYRFAHGRLVEMDEIEVPPPPAEPVKKKIAKKKPAKPQPPAATDNKT
jgi:hypothetical protein